MTVWVAKGKLWLYGGNNSGDYSDLWSFDPATSQWTWVSGATTSGASATYGTEGVAAISNNPGLLDNGNGAVDPQGTLYMFGGCIDESGNNQENSLWIMR